MSGQGAWVGTGGMHIVRYMLEVRNALMAKAHQQSIMREYTPRGQPGGGASRSPLSYTFCNWCVHNNRLVIT